MLEGLKYPASKELFENTNRIVEKVSELLFVIIAKVSPLLSCLPKFFVCFFVYFSAGLESDPFEMPFPTWYVDFYDQVFSWNFYFNFLAMFHRLPYKLNSPFRFLFAITFQYMSVAYLLYIIACVLSLAIGAFIFAIASTKEINRELYEFDKVVNAQRTPEIRLYLLSQFTVFINAHSTVKQLSRYFRDLFMSHMTFQTFSELRPIFRMYFNQYFWYFFRGPWLPFAV